MTLIAQTFGNSLGNFYGHCATFCSNFWSPCCAQKYSSTTTYFGMSERHNLRVGRVKIATDRRVKMGTSRGRYTKEFQECKNIFWRF